MTKIRTFGECPNDGCDALFITELAPKSSQLKRIIMSGLKKGDEMDKKLWCQKCEELVEPKTKVEETDEDFERWLEAKR